MFKLTTIAVVLLITTAINIVVSHISWQRRKTKGGTYFALGISGITLWTLSAALGYAAVPLDLKIFFAKIEAMGYHTAFALFALFSILYAGNDRWLEKKWVKALFVLIPLTNILLTITNELHNSIWTNFVRKADNVVVFEHGPAFNWVIITSYLLIIFIFLNLWLASHKGSGVAQRQVRILMFALLFPVAINLLYRMGAWGIEGVDWSSITFSVSGLLFLYALYGIRLLDIVPIARDKLVNSLSDGMIVLDMQNRIIDANLAASKILVAQHEALIGKELAKLVPLTHSFLEQPPDQEIKTELEVGTPNKLYFDVLISPLREGPKRIIGRLIIFRDITRLKETEAQLRNAYSQLEEQMMEIQGLQHILHEQAIRDALTGLHNRYYLKETLGREFARAEREGYPVCFILIDIDRFKNINDTHGHATGDVVLQHLSNQLKKLTRSGDIVCRYGGEEFLLVLPNTTIEVAAQIAERLRSAFQELNFIENGHEIRATISLGISEFPTDGRTETKVLEKADKALYAAKHNGRNQVMLWSEIKEN